GIAELKESFSTAVGEGFVNSLTTALKEALVPAPVTTEVTDTEGAAAEVTQVVEPDAGEEVEIDHAELATKFAESELPAAVMPNIIAALKEGKTVEEAIASQTTLREAFVAHQPTVTTVRITEAERQNKTL